MTAKALQVAVLDDYQNAARDFGPWPELAGSADVTFFTDHVTGAAALGERLAPFDAIVATRERTRFPREVLERLPRLRLLVSTSMGIEQRGHRAVPQQVHVIDADADRSLAEESVCRQRE